MSRGVFARNCNILRSLDRKSTGLSRNVRRYGENKSGLQRADMACAQSPVTPCDYKSSSPTRGFPAVHAGHAAISRGERSLKRTAPRLWCGMTSQNIQRSRAVTFSCLPQMEGPAFSIWPRAMAIDVFFSMPTACASFTRNSARPRSPGCASSSL